MINKRTTDLGTTSLCGQYLSVLPVSLARQRSMFTGHKCWGCQTRRCVRDICFGPETIERVWLRREQEQYNEQGE